ncbi:hypothetical protein ACJQWK_01354 [Exserohilum turcicum]
MASNEQSVYLGIWTNWSHGAVAGLTYTTTLENGGLLIAFLALFVTFTGTCFWSIVSFTVHQTLSRQAPQGAIYHQQQAILRSSDTSAAALWRLVKLSWAWRKISLTTSVKSTSIPLVASLATFTAFAAAGIFSSRVATSRGGEVLIVGDKCSTFNSSLLNADNIAASQYYGASRIRSSFNYEANCYSAHGSTEGCRTFVRSALPVTVTTGGPCPFAGQDAICRSQNDSIRLDSGYLNSHYDLGINSPPSSRFLYRTVNQCAPILSEGYIRNQTTENSKTLIYQYGDNPTECGDDANGCSMIFDYGIGYSSRTARNEYTVSAIANWQSVPELSYMINRWQPIPELMVQNADIAVFFLELDSIVYATPVSDPWFTAQEGPFNSSTTYGNITSYFGDQSAKALACAQQYQFCNPTLPKNISCTPLMGIFEAARIASSTIFTEPHNKDVFGWSALAIQFMANGFTEIVTILRGGALLASDTLSGVGQYGLPNNQWEIELQHWFRTTLADLQRAILDQATGPADPNATSFYSPPTSAEARAVCGNQKIRSDSYTSFNVLGLSVVFSIGGLIMLISACLPAATTRIQRNRKPFSSLEWISNDTLQLQRLAHEAVGAGDWTGARDDYPLTRKNDLLAVLDIADRKHPVLRSQPTCNSSQTVQSHQKVDDASSIQAQPNMDIMTERTASSQGTCSEGNCDSRMEEGIDDSIQASLLSVEIPRTSLDFPHRFPA